MKKILCTIPALLLLLSAAVAQKVSLSMVGENVFVKDVHVFDVSMNTYGAEAVVRTNSGDAVLTFVPFKVPDGWSSTTSNDRRGDYYQRSGTSYTYFYRVADGSGTFCDVPAKGLRNSRDIAKFVLAFNLIKNESLDSDAFQRCVLMHGKVHRELKNFE